MVAFKQPNSLRNLLVRAEMSKPNTTIGKSHSCGDKRCKCCKHMQHSSSYTSKITGKQYNIYCTVNFWGISCEKSRFYAKKNHIFSNFRGAPGAPPLNPPLISLQWNEGVKDF
jgi:hypothetical protein